jgi:hypothetical protein
MFLPACLGGTHELPIFLLLGVLLFGRGLAKLLGFATPASAPAAEDPLAEAQPTVVPASERPSASHEHVCA